MCIRDSYMNESPWHTKYGQFSQFNPFLPDPLNSGYMGAITHPGGSMNYRDNNNFEPRLGLAWHALDKLVVRGGFALMHTDLGLAPSQLDEYSISTTQNQVSGNPTPIYQISHGPNPIVYPGLLSNGTQPFQGCTNTHRSRDHRSGHHLFQP